MTARSRRAPTVVAALLVALPLTVAGGCPGQDVNNGTVTGKLYVQPARDPDGKGFWVVTCTNNRTDHPVDYRVSKVEFDRTKVGDRCNPVRR